MRKKRLRVVCYDGSAACDAVAPGEVGLVRLPVEAVVIPREKLTRYLLMARAEDDKSKYLAQAGFTAERADELE